MELKNIVIYWLRENEAHLLLLATLFAVACCLMAVLTMPMWVAWLVR
jgi:hypothetical protein